MNYDAIIIGGGHNGLTTACYLAKSGKKVLVLESRKILGGIAAEEEFHPNYFSAGLLHDTSGVRKKVIDDLQLQKCGLVTSGKKATVALLSEAGKAVEISDDAKKDAENISAFSKKDADAYLRYTSYISEISPLLNSVFNEAPPDIENLSFQQLWYFAKKGIALKKLGRKTMTELFRTAPMCVVDFLNYYFETHFIKAGISVPSIAGMFTGPWSAGTTLNLLLHECAAKENIQGGAAALVKALTKAAESFGAEIKTDATVEKIILKKGKAVGVKVKGVGEINAKIVAASCTPQQAFLNLLSPNEIPFWFEQSISHIRSRGTTAKVNLALKQPLKFNASVSSSVEFFRTATTFDKMEKAIDSVKYGTFSNEPILDIYISLGKNVVSILVHGVPYHLRVGWNENQKKQLGENVINYLKKFTSDFSIAATEVISPLDMEQKYGLTGGHIFHGEHAIDQFVTRPVPSCMQYKTPIEGLFVCGSGSHPGGGITCAPGMLAAKEILK